MSLEEALFGRLWTVDSSEALVVVLRDIQSNLDAIVTKNGDTSGGRVLTTLDAHEHQHPGLWTNSAIDLKRALHDRILEATAPSRNPILTKGTSDSSYATNALLRLTSLGRSTSSVGGAAAATTPRSGVRNTYRPSLDNIDQQGSTTDTLLRSIGSFLGYTETCYCQICLEYVDVASTIMLNACGHRFCIECMEGYVASKITDGLVYPTCFFTSPPSDDGSDSAIPTTCHAAIHPTDLRAVISSDEVWSKYEKFKFNKEHANARECPFCHHVQVSATAAVDPAITCDECHEVYCFSHSSAHPGTSCVEYEKSRRAEEKLNQAKISQIAKLCPGCKSPVEKSGGCNQMKCITCGIHFCWLCGKQVDDGVFPEHFQWWNLAGCAGAQMSESTAGQPSMLNKISWFLFRLVLCIVFGPPAFLMAIAFSIIGCCCIPCCMTSRETGQSTFLGCFCISGWVLMVPAALVLALPFLPFGLVAFYFWPDQVRALWQDEDQVPAIPPDDHPSTMYADDTAPPPSASPVADEDDLPGPYHHI